LALEEHHVRPWHACGTSPGTPRPRQRGTVGLRRIRGGDHERTLVAGRLTELAQPLDGAAERELRTAEALDEVAATAEAESLERSQLAVHRSVAAGNPFRPHRVARDDAVPLEQQLRERAALSRLGEEP